MKKIEEFKIVECRGDDKFGRKVIVCSACRLPHANKIKDSEFQSIDKFYHYLLKYKTNRKPIKCVRIDVFCFRLDTL